MEKIFLKQIGRNIKAERVRRGYSQEELAELAETTRRTVCLVEGGLQHPKLFLVVKFAKALNVDINEFLKISIE